MSLPHIKINSRKISENGKIFFEVRRHSHSLFEMIGNFSTRKTVTVNVKCMLSGMQVAEVELPIGATIAELKTELAKTTGYVCSRQSLLLAEDKNGKELDKNVLLGEISHTQVCKGRKFDEQFVVNSISSGETPILELLLYIAEPIDIYRACRSGNLEAVQDAVDCNQDINHADSLGHTPLLICLKANKTTIFDYLMTLPNVDVNKGDKYGQVIATFALDTMLD